MRDRAEAAAEVVDDASPARSAAQGGEVVLRWRDGVFVLDLASTADQMQPDAAAGRYSTRNGMIRVTYGSSCKATQLGGMENAPKGLARMILAEQVREALGHNEAED